ncbi:MAG: cbb3-type cytochrome oxidase assembly protein CcoS [Hyphomonadaceae bacterium]
MSVLLYMIAAALGLAILALAGFLWALHSGQFEDPAGASWRALNDEQDPSPD